MEKYILENTLNNLLQERNYERIAALSIADTRVWRLLQLNLYHQHDIIRWHTIEMIALLMRQRWDDGDREKVLDYIRRHIWTITDESGGIGWSSPQAIAEIISLIPEIYDPWINNMIDRSFKEPALINSGLWAVGRLGKQASISVDIFEDLILTSFNTESSETLGLAAWALGEVGMSASYPHIQKLVNLTQQVGIYISPEIREKSVGEWARESLQKMA